MTWPKFQFFKFRFIFLSFSAIKGLLTLTFFVALLLSNVVLSIVLKPCHKPKSCDFWLWSCFRHYLFSMNSSSFYKVMLYCFKQLCTLLFYLFYWQSFDDLTFLTWIPKFAYYGFWFFLCYFFRVDNWLSSRSFYFSIDFCMLIVVDCFKNLSLFIFYSN